MKTLEPFILTARVLEHDMEPFDRLRREHFPADRNFLRAHLTMFHRLPGEYISRIVEDLAAVAAGYGPISAEVNGLRHLGAGVAFTIASPALQEIHAKLKTSFRSWLGGQDMQKWQPHITVQNKVDRSAADRLHHELLADFRPHPVEIVGLDLWKYLGGPWQHEASVAFGGPPG